VIFAVILYHDYVGLGKISGIVIAFPAIYLTSRVEGAADKPQNLFWPAILFIGSGLLDTLMKYVQTTYLGDPKDQAVYAIFVFTVAAVIGLILVAASVLFKKTTLHWKNIVAGICVGVPNYFSIYYLIRMLNSNFMQSSAAIPVLNIGILVASSLMAIALFKEKANWLRAIGLGLSVIAILLIAFGDK
jgi:drug/metabolite transporter (DMT)-like permease